MAESKKYFWLKLKRDFFKRHDIQIIESMPNGKDYILFYLKLLCESEGGRLRFSDEIPFDMDMLSIITKTDIDIVITAMLTLSHYGLISVLEDGTIIVRKPKDGARDRNSTEYKEWRSAVFERDNYTCQKCKAKGVRLNAHHIKSWRSFPQSRYDPTNGITLCEKCHKEYHKKNGRT